jgi:hypothetical protein
MLSGKNVLLPCSKGVRFGCLYFAASAITHAAEHAYGFLMYPSALEVHVHSVLFFALLCPGLIVY